MGLTCDDFPVDSEVWFEADPEGHPIWDPIERTSEFTGLWNKGLVQDNDQEIRISYHTTDSDLPTIWFWPDPEVSSALYEMPGFVRTIFPRGGRVHDAVRASSTEVVCECGYDKIYGVNNTIHIDWCIKYDPACDPTNQYVLVRDDD